ncbi:TonB-dependent receptor plug domain protein, partial [Ostertagia ostertagi]
MKKVLNLLVIMSIGLCLHAQPPAGDAKPEIVITSSRSLNERMTLIGKLPVKPMDLPQSVVVIGKDVLERQQVLHISDALQNVNGVYLMGASGGFQEEIAARGLAFNSSNTFKNGVRYNNSIMPELSSVEKLEFLKGGSAILFGNVSAGGVMNIVTRKPKFDTGGEISFRTGSFDFYKPSIDVYGSLNVKRTAAFRLNTTYEKAGSFRDQDYNSKLFAAARPNANSSFVQPNGTWVRGLQKSKTNEDYYLAQADLTGKFRTGKVEHLLLVGADADRYNTSTTAFVTNAFNNGLANTSIRGKNIYDTINIFDPYGSSFSKREDIPYLAPNTITTSPIKRFGVYVQDLLSVTKHFKLLVGARYSLQENSQATVDTVAKSTHGYIAAYTSRALSPRIGLVYQPLKVISIFASYTNNFSPNTGVDTFNAPLKPSIIDQFEAGVKTDFFKGALSVNVTAYRIINSDFALSVVNPPASAPAAKELVGEVTSKGVELDISTRSIHGFSIIAGYSYNDTRYTKSNGHNSSVKVGDRLRYNPSHTANGSIYYAFPASSVLRGFSIGAGAFYTGNRLAGRNTTGTNPGYRLMPLPDYTLFDVSAGYTTGRYAFRLKLSNIGNTLSYNVHDDNSVNPIAPRQVAAT